MRDILTVTLNPSLDLAADVASVEPNQKLRCEMPHTDPGGGGTNVSRAIRLLGGMSRTFVALGGATGDRVEELLIEAGLDVIRHEAPDETRQSLVVTSKTTGDQYRFMLPGPKWFPLDSTAAEAAIVEAAKPDSLVVLSGSLPPGMPPQVMPDLCERLAEKGAQVVADTSGPALHLFASGEGPRPHVLRMNHFEGSEIVGHPLGDLKETADLASELIERGAADIVIVARGPEGSVLATKDQRLHSHAAEVPVRSKVGAGDTFVGSFTLSLAQGRPLDEALSHAVAAASAAVMTEGTLLCRPEDAARLIAHCPARPI
ncbi:1-phosphofructokinase family hexose kinase [Ponticoccus sp. SC2-23]|nr:1-phosphofructokinase family hexose kinase [Alexandriicola marinus]MBM1221230.1 1-phosphofructokinase family hexose kinase [Ponticoccus sp. SC6-9]MBM1225800.1 1-phosphofructokinase family hexose kinase [Ponticoccus sp. SC6-15]MBM1227952.1 1-phosphofructokinase family hexose kinase [Ponticoccus sp. SC6-38]MBM1234410.1 1-phosphofructokinase family hexose kinase [Ponticoccus sp. SC6-45]MBM1238454.1 1-phosphofructokinase family hexose kinase [Ponticoccus sp. SC6-49]MBM1243723.1 1-phosphofructo